MAVNEIFVSFHQYLEYFPECGTVEFRKLSSQCEHNYKFPRPVSSKLAHLNMLFILMLTFTADNAGDLNNNDDT